ncbi:MAG: hypothetical protein ACI81F_001982 [Thalassolituus oleivorans]|jgi:hypothetical protein
MNNFDDILKEALRPTATHSLDLESIKMNSLMRWRHEQLPTAYLTTRKTLITMAAATIIGSLVLIDSSLYPSLSALAAIPTILHSS